jgi:predicted TIM-barrel enzyme
MVHVGALPGTPAARQSLDEIVGLAVAEARIYGEEGFTAIALENMHDRALPEGRGRAGNRGGDDGRRARSQA